MSDDHGTYSAVNRHVRAGEPCCPPCKEFRRHYMRDRRAKLASGRKFTYPVQSPALDLFDGMGATIARAFRESA